MNNKFDELTKQMAQSVTRRAALKKFGIGVTGMLLGCFGLANQARAATYSGYCEVARSPNLKGGSKWNLTGYCIGVDPATGDCTAASSAVTGGVCPQGPAGSGHDSPCGGYWAKGRPCSFTI
jgi:hypothetical protein